MDKLFHPPSIPFSETPLYQFMQKHGFDTLEDVHRRVKQDQSWFWQEIEKEIGLTWFTPYQAVYDDENGIEWTRWFVGGELNIVYDAVDKWCDRGSGEKTALSWEGDGGETSELTYAQLKEQVSRAANGLKAHGVNVGDRIILFMPMWIETAVLLLAANKIGAIVVPVFSGFGAEAIIMRAELSGASMIMTGDCVNRRGKAVNMLDTALEVVKKVETINKILIVNSQATKTAQSNHDHKQAIHEHKLEGISAEIGDHNSMHKSANKSFHNRSHKSSNYSFHNDNHYKTIYYDDLLHAHSPEHPPQFFASETPCLILYTSGTTGKPKGTVHVHSGFPFKAAHDLKFAFAFRDVDKICWLTDMGWMMGPWLIYGGLLLGGTVQLFSGTPDYPDESRLWQLVHRQKITYLGVSPTAIRLLAARNILPQDSDLASLRAFASTGEPWNHEPWLWLFQTVGQSQYPIINYSGGTEIAGGILAAIAGLPQAPCAFSGAIPGMVVAICDEFGHDIQEQDHLIGELMLKQAWPGMTRGFWQANEQYLDTYWRRFSSCWVHGDLVRKTSDGQWFIDGRSDDTLKIAGKRLGPAEFETVLVNHDRVIEAAVIGIPHDIKGQIAVAFVVTKDNINGHEENQQLMRELRELIAKNLGKAFLPHALYKVEELPKTRNGKILRRLLRSLYLKQEQLDLSSLDNLSSIAAIKRIMV